VVREGRYGPYVTHNKVNATLPKDIAPDTITLEQAAALIDAKPAKGGNGPRKSKGKAAETAPPTESKDRAARDKRPTAKAKSAPAPRAARKAKTVK
jgi:DNA topoisomerase-1